MATMKCLEMDPAEPSDVEYRRLSYIYDELMRHDNVRSTVASILGALDKVTEHNSTLILEKPLKLIDVCVIWGSPKARLIRDVIYKDESTFRYDSNARSQELSRFENIYGLSPPKDLLLLFHFYRLAIEVFGADYDGNNLFESLEFIITDGVMDAVDPTRPEDSMALVRGKHLYHCLDYYPFALTGYRSGGYGILIDYYHKHIVTASFDSTERRYDFSRNAWDVLLRIINSEIPFRWTRTTGVLYCKKYPSSDEEDMSDRIKMIVHSLLVDREKLESYAWDEICDDLLPIQYVMLQRLACAYLKRNPVDLYSIRKADYLRYYGYPRTISKPRGLYMDSNEYWHPPRRALPISFSRFKETKTIDAIRGFCDRTCDLYGRLVLNHKCGWQVDLPEDAGELMQDFYDLLKNESEFVIGVGPDNLSSIKENLVIISKVKVQDALSRCESILTKLCDYAVAEANDGFPLLAYYFAFHYWDVCEPKATEMAIRLYKVALPHLGMDKLLDTVEMLEEARFRINQTMV